MVRPLASRGRAARRIRGYFRRFETARPYAKNAASVPRAVDARREDRREARREAHRADARDAADRTPFKEASFSRASDA
jgi:hypothetical protein